jgi:CHAD domain-containing protein
VLREAIWRAYDAILAYDVVDLDFERLHKLRSECRRLRYLLELFGDAAPGGAPLAAKLREIQDGLGRMHDRHVAIERVTDLQRRGRVDGGAAIAAFVDASRRARDAARRELEPRWTELFGAPFRARLAAALEPAGPRAR